MNVHLKSGDFLLSAALKISTINSYLNYHQISILISEFELRTTTEVFLMRFWAQLLESAVPVEYIRRPISIFPWLLPVLFLFDQINLSLTTLIAASYVG